MTPAQIQSKAHAYAEEKLKDVSRTAMIGAFGAFAACALLQYRYGKGKDFFYHSFVTRADSEALSEFYQAEDLLKIISIHPILFDLFMNKVDPDTSTPTEETMLLSLNETVMRVRLLGMDAAFEIIEEEEEGPDGEDRLVSFERLERFIDWAPILNDYGIKIMLWDQTWNFGFKRLDDDTIEVFHHGKSFSGPWPVRVVVWLHQRYVIWACEKFINGKSFGTEDLAAQEEELAFIPKQVVKDWFANLFTFAR